jgi:hypothetical protein
MEWNDIHREDRKRINLTEIIKIYSIKSNQTDKWDYLGGKKPVIITNSINKTCIKTLYNTNT